MVTHIYLSIKHILHLKYFMNNRWSNCHNIFHIFKLSAPTYKLSLEYSGKKCVQQKVKKIFIFKLKLLAPGKYNSFIISFILFNLFLLPEFSFNSCKIS